MKTNNSKGLTTAERIAITNREIEQATAAYIKAMRAQRSKPVQMKR
jgi:hypothetical protein